MAVLRLLFLLVGLVPLVHVAQSEQDHESDGNKNPAIFTLGKPELLGSGCPTPASVHTTTAPDHQSISIQFSDFQAVTTGASTRDRRACNLLLPLHVHEGTSIAVVHVEYHGRVKVPVAAGASARFQNEYFFAGIQGAGHDQTWPAGTNTTFQLQNDFQFGAVAWSPCGATSFFRINAAVSATRAFGTKDTAEISVGGSGFGLTDAVRFGVTSRVCTP